jgi:hypothetical protein
LTSLRQLSVQEVPSALAAGLTQLTSLKLTPQLTTKEDTWAELPELLSGMSHLQQLELEGSNLGMTAEALQLLLLTCSQLKKLSAAV